MRMEAAYTALTDSRRGPLAAPALNDNRTLAAMGRRHMAPAGSIYRAAPAAGRFRKLTLGLAAAALALFLTPVLPSMVDPQAVQLGVAQPLHAINNGSGASVQSAAPQAAPAAVAPASTAQEDANRAPAAFSDALAAAPAQCSVTAHSCSAASDDGSARTALAYRAAQAQRAGQHHERM